MRRVTPIPWPALDTIVNVPTYGTGGSIIKEAKREYFKAWHCLAIDLSFTLKKLIVHDECPGKCTLPDYNAFYQRL